MLPRRSTHPADPLLFSLHQLPHLLPMRQVRNFPLPIYAASASPLTSSLILQDGLGKAHNSVPEGLLPQRSASSIEALPLPLPRDAALFPLQRPTPPTARRPQRCLIRGRRIPFPCTDDDDYMKKKKRKNTSRSPTPPHAEADVFALGHQLRAGG